MFVKMDSSQQDNDDFRRCFIILFILLALADSSGIGTALAANGTCGSFNGINYAVAPTTGLCSIGTPSTVTGIGPWFWDCPGINGGSTANCSAAQAGGVVFRSTDSGLTWTPGKTGVGLNTVASPLLVSPTYASDRTLFLGADGVFKSTDSGDTWTRVVSTGSKCNDFAVSPSYSIDRTIFAGDYFTGIYKSVNGGTTWTTSNTGLSPTKVFSLAISPAFTSDQTIFSGVFGAGVFKSIDSGSTWSISNTGMGAVSPLSLAISPVFASDRTILAVTSDGLYVNGGPNYHIYKSTDGGANWAQSDTGISGSISVIKISSGYAIDQTLFTVTSSGVYKSTDRGANWTQVNSGSFSALALSPAYAGDQTLFAGYFGVNVFNSTTGGSSWSASNSDFLTKKQLASLAVSPAYRSDHTAFTVVSLAAPMINVTPTVLSFAPVDPNSSSLPKQVTIINGMVGLMGSGNLAITSMALSGAGAGDFTLAPGLCGSLKPSIVSGSQCSFDVIFTPKSSGSKSATLTITPYDVFNSPQTITLTGTGITTGACSGDNGYILAKAAPTASCTTGVVSTVTGSGHPWLWTCQGDVGTDPATCNASIQTYSLTVTVPVANGKGAVQADIASNDSTPLFIFCSDGVCSAYFDFGKTVRLTATPEPASLFTSWEGDCAAANPCEISMMGTKATTANFTRDIYFKNAKSGYLNDALGTVVSAAFPDDEIRMLTAEATVDAVTVDKALTISGGWKALHTAQTETPTTLVGTLTIKDADSSLSNTTVKGGLFIQNGNLKVNGVTVRN
jgi:hypothetical protein